MKNKVSKKTGKKTGKRQVFTKKRRTYRGGDMNGILVYRYNDNSYFFNGEISDDGKLTGEGTLTLVDSHGEWVRYNGIWNNSKLTQGTIREKEGKLLYKGGLITNPHYDIIPHGSGTMSFKNNVYNGHWENGEYNGLGTMTFENGDEYNGHWENGQRHGLGTYKKNRIYIYNGHWENGEKNGSGTMTFENGDEYIGQWKNGEKNGLGIHFIRDNGIQFSGTWVNNNCENGTCTYPDGTKLKCTLQEAEEWQPTHPSTRSNSITDSN